MRERDGKGRKGNEWEIEEWIGKGEGKKVERIEMRH